MDRGDLNECIYASGNKDSEINTKMGWKQLLIIKIFRFQIK